MVNRERIDTGNLVWRWLLLNPSKKIYSSLRALFRLDNHAVIESGHPSLERFLDRNAAVWDETGPSLPDGGSEVLIEALSTNVPYLVSQGLVGRYFSEALNLRPVGLHRKDSTVSRRIFESFGIEEHVSMEEIGGMRPYFSALSEAKSALHGLDRESLLSWQKYGLDLGILVYDDYLRHAGGGRFDASDPHLIGTAIKGLVLLEAYRDLFELRDVDAVVQRGNHYLEWGLLSRVAVKTDSTVYCPKGPFARPTIRRYEDIERIRTLQWRPTESEFEELWSGCRGAALELAQKTVARRLSGKSADKEHDEFLKGYRDCLTPESEESLRRRFGWTKEKPLVFVMAHVMGDADHHTNELLFTDHHDWLTQTLESARKNTDVHWVVKPHPGEVHYSLRDTAQDIFSRKAENAPHIGCLGYETNTASLIEPAHAVITAVGTPGLEFACKGIPPVTAGEAPYSGFGFTLDHEDREDYFTTLSRIEQLETLGEEEVQRARIVAFLYFDLMRSPSSLLSQSSQHRESFAEFLDQTTMLLAEEDPSEDPLREAVRAQVQTGWPHIRNPEFQDRIPRVFATSIQPKEG